MKRFSRSSFSLVLSATLAVGAIAANACQAANWTVKGAALPSGSSESLKETATPTKFGSETLPTLKIVAPSWFTIECTGLNVQAAKITGPNLGPFTNLAFNGCKASVPGQKEPCTLVRSSESQANGTIVTQALKSSLSGNGKGETFDYISSVGETLFFLEFGGCPIATHWKVIGSIGLKPEYKTNALQLGFETSQAIQGASGATWDIYTEKMWMQAKFDVSLVSGKTWGVTP